MEVDLPFGGTISVVGRDSEGVQVTARSLTGQAGEIEMQASVQGETIVLIGPSGAPETAHAVALELRVPPRFDLQLETEGGRLRVKGVSGMLFSRTGGGDIELDRVGGILDMETGGGHVLLHDSIVEGRVSTEGGHIALSEVRGDVESFTAAGNVRYHDSAAPGGGTRRRVETAGGNIVIDAAPHGIEARTQGGNIEVSQAGGDCDLFTAAGDIRVGQLAGSLDAETRHGSIRVRADRMAAGDALELRAEGGNVEVLLPADFSGPVEAEIVYTKQSERRYSIDSDVPLRLRRSERWDYGGNEPVQWIRGRGEVSTGAGSLRIETRNGDIRIRRAQR